MDLAELWGSTPGSLGAWGRTAPIELNRIRARELAATGEQERAARARELRRVACLERAQLLRLEAARLLGEAARLEQEASQ